MKKIISCIISITLLCTSMSAFASASSVDHVVNEIYSISQLLSINELKTEISNAATLLGEDEMTVATKILDEIKEEQAFWNDYNQNTRVNSRASYQLRTLETGGVFWEPAKTIIPHGHVGIYYNASTIIESMPGDGVRQMSCNDKWVDTGSMTAKVNQTSDEKWAAANWAYNCLGDEYSTNFATNRLTGAYGAKNCSKLVWCAYKETSGIDLDSDGGLGVYPNDIKESSYLTNRSYY